MNAKKNKKTLIITLCSIGVLLIGIYLIVTKPNYQEIINNVSKIDIPFLNSLVNNQEEEKENNIGDVKEFSLDHYFPGEDSGIRFNVIAQIPSNTISVQDGDSDMVIMKNEKFILIIKQVLESNSELLPKIPEYTKLNETNFKNTIFRVRATSIYLNYVGMIDKQENLDYQYKYYYTDSFMLHDECDKYWDTIETYEACDQASIAVKDDSLTFKGILRIYCEVQDINDLYLCDDIVKTLNIETSTL